MNSITDYEYDRIILREGMLIEIKSNIYMVIQLYYLNMPRYGLLDLNNGFVDKLYDNTMEIVDNNEGFKILSRLTIESEDTNGN